MSIYIITALWIDFEFIKQELYDLPYDSQSPRTAEVIIQ